MQYFKDLGLSILFNKIKRCRLSRLAQSKIQKVLMQSFLMPYTACISWRGSKFRVRGKLPSIQYLFLSGRLKRQPNSFKWNKKHSLTIIISNKPGSSKQEKYFFYYLERRVTQKEAKETWWIKEN